MELSEIAKKLNDNLVEAKKVNVDFVKENFVTDDPVKLNQLIISLGPIYAYYSGFYAKAKRDTYFSKLELRDHYNSAYIGIKNNALKNGLKMTESHLNSVIEAHEDHKTLNKKYMDALSNEGTLGAMVDSLKTKKELLWTLACNQRTEQKTVYNDVQ